MITSRAATAVRCLTALAAAAAALALLAPAALARSVVARRGALRASFTYSGSFPNVRDGSLELERAGRVLYDRPVSAMLCANHCDPGVLGARRSALAIVDLAPSGRPDVVLSLYSGGAHCCTVIQVLHYSASRRSWVLAQRDFGDPGARLVDLRHNGRFELLSADDRFAYAFTDYAASGLPLQILDFPGRFAVITRRFPGLIARDAARFLRAFEAMAPHYRDSVGMIAAWAADEDELGHSARVASFLRRQARLGHLNTGLGQAGYPHGLAFVRKLDRFLRRTGYLH
jgi:hypothetical protein